MRRARFTGRCYGPGHLQTGEAVTIIREGRKGTVLEHSAMVRPDTRPGQTRQRRDRWVPLQYLEAVQEQRSGQRRDL